MDNAAGIAVAVEHKIVRYKIADHLIHIYRFLDVPLVQILQGLDEPVLIGIRHIKYRVVEDIGVAVVRFIRIDQQNVRAASHPCHAAKTLSLIHI